MILRTKNFVSKESAKSYFSEIGYNKEEVEQKIENKTIIIGEPNLNPGEKLVSDEGRYFIEI